jgi:hypothetical protein
MSNFNIFRFSSSGNLSRGDPGLWHGYFTYATLNLLLNFFNAKQFLKAIFDRFPYAVTMVHKRSGSGSHNVFTGSLGAGFCCRIYGLYSF